jgi:hypothetical protein
VLFGHQAGGQTRYYPSLATAAAGETVALIGLFAALIGLAWPSGPPSGMRHPQS